MLQEGAWQGPLARRAGAVDDSREGDVAVMQPSFSVSLRSLVTIFSLIGIPAVAVVGVSAPHALQTSKYAYKPVLESAAPACGEDSQTQAATPAASGKNDPAAGVQTETTGGSAPDVAATGHSMKDSSPVFWTGAEPPQSTQPASILLVRESRPNKAPNYSDALDSDVEDSHDRFQPTGGRIRGQATPVSHLQEREAAAASAEIPVSPPTVGQDNFSVLERRLRELGATQYRLETWGADGDLYRFRCLMAVSERPSHNRYFEATDADALRAMQRVLANVERWRARR
jgi:hypothetical protein